MNQDERRALKLLQDQGVKVDETEFRRWCQKRKPVAGKDSNDIPKLIAREWTQDQRRV